MTELEGTMTELEGTMTEEGADDRARGDDDRGGGAMTEEGGQHKSTTPQTAKAKLCHCNGQAEITTRPRSSNISSSLYM